MKSGVTELKGLYTRYLSDDAYLRAVFSSKKKGGSKESRIISGAKGFGKKKKPTGLQSPVFYINFFF